MKGVDIMIAFLIGKNKINKVVLPKYATGNYWIMDSNAEKILNIEADEDKWQIISNKHIKIIKENNIVFDENRITINNIYASILDKVILEEYKIYTLLIGNTNEIYLLYCAPVYENNYLQIELTKGREILIGKDKNNDIVYNSNIVSSVHAKLSFSNGKWIIENFDKKFGTFVNQTPVFKDIRVLLNGDVIFIMGLKIIIIGNTFFVNNPQNKVDINYNKFKLKEQRKIVNSIKEEEEEEEEEELYNENDYYYRSPRIRSKIEREEVNIDPPPPKEKREEMPTALVLGSTLSMSAVMLTSVFSTIKGMKDGTTSTSENVISLIVAFTMLLSMLLFPMLEKGWEKKQQRKNEKKRQEKYKEYIDTKVKEIDKIMGAQRRSLFRNYPSVEKCSDIILSKSERLWERKIEDYDFLSVRLGIGDIPSEIDIQYPEKQFEIEEDNLVDILNTVAKKSKILKKVPIALSLTENNIVGIVSTDEQEQKRFMQDIIMQLITFHSYTDLKLVFFLKQDNLNRWNLFQMLPHIWNNVKDIRFFSDNIDEIKEISTYLEEVFQNRNGNENENNDIDYKSFSPYYLIITDDYKKIEKINIVKEIVHNKNNLGFGMICLSDNITKLPNECKSFVTIDNGTGEVFASEIDENKRKIFKFDDQQRLFFEKISRTISNIPIRSTSLKDMVLPNTYSFLEMYDVGNIEQLNVLERWKRNDATLSLKAPIGVDSSGMKIYLDIHEKFHGPHGLIAGSTGSGKSEFIITYILSLAINYHPDDVAFILIDYKGGGLAGAFQKRDMKLPHLVGTITNIDKVGLQRSLASIQSELRRRQIMFNEARNKTDEGTIDIYKYQKLYHDGVVSTPIPHLLIICDEFAELKQQQEDFMDELISVARIGRSLGVHLILATQKPAGVVDEQIRSNSKFGICLKVQDKYDSDDVIGRPDAAFLKNAGQFYMEVGNDEYFVLGQSGWAGAKYIPSDTTKKKEDKSIEFISNMGTPIKKVNDSMQKSLNDEGEQLTCILKHICDLANNHNIKAKQLWLDNIPENIYIKDLKEKYKVKPIQNEVISVIGEYDDPENQSQGIVQLNLTKDGNTIIFGSADSGKETLLSAIIYDTMTTYSPNEAQIYITDFGSEALKIFKKSPSVGDVIFSSDDEKLSRFFGMIEKEIKIRKAILSEYNGDYDLYLKTSGKAMPLIINIINGYEAFMEMYEDKYEDLILSLTREGFKCGIVFIFTASSTTDLRYRLSQNFKQKIALQMNNDDDYSSVFDRVGKKRPSHLFGRGLISLNDDRIYEFQTAKICEPLNWNTFVKEEIERLNQSYKISAPEIPTIPKKVNIEDVKKYITDISNLPIGIERNTLEVCTYNFTKRKLTLISSKNIEEAAQFAIHLIEEIKLIKDNELFVLDAENVLKTKKDDLEREYTKLSVRLNQQNEKYAICIIIGIDKFINSLDESETEFLEMLQKSEANANFSFIIVENATKVKNHEYDEWYSNYLTGEDGIWVGNGVDDQYLFTIASNEKVVNNCGPSFGYIISAGQEKMIKLLGIKDKGDEDE